MATLTSRGLAPVRETLANGAVILVKESHTTPAVTISAQFQAGSLYDPPDLPGVASFLSRVIDRGTGRRSADLIADVLDDRGVSLAVSVTRHVMTLTCNCLAEDFEPMVELIAEVARQPTLSEVEIEKRRPELTTSLRQDEDNPAARAVETLLELLYSATHPYGRRSKGTIESLARIQRPDLVGFQRARFAPASLAMVVVGAVDAARALDVTAAAFDDWRVASAPPPAVAPPPPPAGRRSVVVPMMNKAQADVAYGFVTITRDDPAYYPFWIMNTVFGHYGLGGRLGDHIRERQGMAYYAFSSFEANVAPGPLIIRAGVSPANVERAIAAIDEEVEKMAAEGVTPKELADAKLYLIGSIPRMLETNQGIATFLQTLEQFDLGLDYDQRLPDLLGAVTADEVLDAARQVLCSGQAAVVVAGPYEGQRA